MSAKLPVIPSIRTFEDVRRALENIRSFYSKGGGGVGGTTLVQIVGGPSGLSRSVPGTDWGNIHGDPPSPKEGDRWYDLDAHQYKGFNGTIPVIMG